MSGIAGFFRHDLEPGAVREFLLSTDLLRTGFTRDCSHSTATVGVSAPSAAWLERRCVETADAFIAIAGQPITDGEIRWVELLECLRTRNREPLRALSGRFTLAVLDRPRSTLHLVTDRIAQYPLYVLQRGSLHAFSTSQASFARLPQRPGIDERWIHEVMLINFAASHSSFFEGVRRLAPASVLRVDLRSGDADESQYAPQIVPRIRRASPREELARGREVFERRMPLFLRDDEHASIGLSGGFDSRTLLAFFRARLGVGTYTYGVPGCSDMLDAQHIATALSLPHRELPFDTAFTEELARLAVDAVWLSSGLERAARATLPYVYRTLAAANASGPHCILSGVSADQIFRGHGNVPSIVSPAMDVLFRTGRWPEDLAERCERVFVRPRDAVASAHSLARKLEHQYGDLRQPAAHLSYMIYEVPGEYFAGEACLADQFFDFRSPFCDTGLIEFAASTSFSTLGLSKFARVKQDALEENRFPALLIARDRALSALPVHRRPVWVYARRRRLAYWLFGALHRPARRPPLEDWNTWFKGPLLPLSHDVLTKACALEAYVKPSYLRESLVSGDPSKLNKLLTLELVLRLAMTGWDRAAVPGTGVLDQVPRSR